MSVYKPAKSPWFHYDFQMRGRRFYGSTGKTSRRAAEAVEAEAKEAARAEVARSRALFSAPMTIDVACDRYWVEIGQHHRRPDQTEWSLVWILAALGKDKLISEISNDDVAKMVARRRGEPVVNAARDKGRNRRSVAAKLVSPSRVNRSVTEPLRKVLRRARDVWGQPIMAIDWKAHLLKEPAERIRVLREGEEEARVFACLPAQYHPIVRVQMRIGLRIGELIALRWQDVDWGARRLTIAGKGGSLDTVPIPAGVRDILWGLQGCHPERVFVQDSGDPMTYSGVDTAWGRALEKAGMTGLHLHDLRHTAATRLLSKSQNLRLAQKLLRHRGIRSTLRYAHALDEDLRDALEAAESPGRSPEAAPKPLIKKG
jgi:integrase